MRGTISIMQLEFASAFAKEGGIVCRGLERLEGNGDMAGGWDEGWWTLLVDIYFMLNSGNCGDLLPSHELLYLMFLYGYGEDDMSIMMHESLVQYSNCPIDRQMMVMKLSEPGI